VFNIFTGTEIIESQDIGDFAIELASKGWAVLPLRGKLPIEAGGRGVLDTTTSYAQIIKWWGIRYRGANIGVRVPAGLVVLDVDPRHHGDKTLEQLVAQNRPLPATLTVHSGRGDGGRHLYWLRPPGKLSAKRLGVGLDVKTDRGYVVVPPSRHPETGKPYRWELRDPVAPPRWVSMLMQPPAELTDAGKFQPQQNPAAPQGFGAADSIADAFTARTSWRDLLPRHG
jgi:hypothetical protein